LQSREAKWSREKETIPRNGNNPHEQKQTESVIVQSQAKDPEKLEQSWLTETVQRNSKD
jgi:hypothetical protein